ncbi:hypothetical protein GCM10010277_83280 [Streptomyces longisporoflavus]|uniref:hypothetical protein n=1 Tax=Streptomyces longisporoflavus TaxID=28044 RepID=UPI00167D9DAB|nr:hypothetical protein [Streptomyces longisporoflavus]GGV71420.1 hypothetical protein GCM10010277_83280 [Streptomyces longisporoflavus]
MDDRDETWHRFLTDNERAIRRTAPRELSAQERLEAAARRRDAEPPPPGPPARSSFEPVGDLWQPASASEPVSWNAMDGWGRLRLALRALGALAVLVAALAALSRQPTGAIPDPGRPEGVTLQEAEEAPDGLDQAPIP